MRCCWQEWPTRLPVGLAHAREDCLVYCAPCLSNSHLHDYNGEPRTGNNLLSAQELISSLLDFSRKKWGALVILADNLTQMLLVLYQHRRILKKNQKVQRIYEQYLLTSMFKTQWKKNKNIPWNKRNSMLRVIWNKVITQDSFPAWAADILG